MVRFLPSFRATLFTVASLLLITTATLNILGAGVAHTKLVTATDNSLRPIVQQGNGLLVREVEANKLHQGDILSYYSATDQSTPTEGRLVSLPQTKGRLTVANARDSLKSIPLNYVIGRVDIHIARLGYLLSFLHTLPGLIAGLYLPSLIVIATELRRLSRNYSGHIYRLGHYA